MGLVYAEIELINGGELALLRKKMIEEEVRRIKIKALVNLTVYTLVINECIREQLQLSVAEKRKFKLQDDSIAEYDIVSPVELRFKKQTNYL